MSNPHAPSTTLVDVVVVGAGPAGLQAALTLGRMHRSTVIIDSGRPRNAPVRAMHHFLTHEGTAPAEFRARARGELAQFDHLTFVAGEVTELVSNSPDQHLVTTTHGTRFQSRRVILATGVRDTLPALPGVDALFGTLVHHCPFCHGHELADGEVGVLASDWAEHVATLLRPIVPAVTVVHGAASVSQADGRVRVRMEDGSSRDFDGLFVAPSVTPSSSLGESVGAAVLPSGALEIDLQGHTTVPGILACGDGAHHRDLPQAMASVLAAAASGQTAAATCVKELAAPSTA